MRFVLVNQFYPPDVAPTGLYLHDLARALVARGHRVVVVASQHAYSGGGRFAARECLDGVEVRRVSGFAFGRSTYAGKLADYAGYYARLALELFRGERFDRVVCLTTPPFVALLGRFVAGLTGARHAHWVMDLYPDVLEAHGMGNRAVLEGLRVLARASYAEAQSVITLGPAMAERTQRYSPVQVDWVPLWSPAELSPWPGEAQVPLRAERGWENDRLVLLYSGNFGLGHRFGEFLGAADRLGPKGPRWAFAGSGRARSWVAGFAADHPELPIELLPYAPASRLREHLCSADVHLISMDARWEGTLLPSKLQASMAVGRPVIFVGTQTQDVARWLLESGAGWVVAENDIEGLMAAVRQASDPLERARRGALAAEYARTHFDRERNLASMVDLYTR